MEAHWLLSALNPLLNSSKVGKIKICDGQLLRF